MTKRSLRQARELVWGIGKSLNIKMVLGLKSVGKKVPERGGVKKKKKTRGGKALAVLADQVKKEDRLRGGWQSTFLSLIGDSEKEVGGGDAAGKRMRKGK